MTKKILILGSEGFIGKSFINYHLNYNENLFMVDIQDIQKENYIRCNATDFEQINKIIQEIIPHEIYNFSGSFSNDLGTDFLNNVVITKNIFESILKNQIECKILINGSAAEYGFIGENDYFVNEEYPFNPISLYGLTKVYQTFLARTYFNRHNLKVYIARPFNPMGYGISDKLFIGRLLNQIKSHLEKGSEILLGNLDNERDYIDIEDVIRAYSIIMADGTPGEAYNIGSGESIRIRELLLKFLEVFGIDKKVVKEEEKFVKKFDIPKIIADTSKLRNLKWESQVPLEKSVERIKDLILKDLE